MADYAIERVDELDCAFEPSAWNFAIDEAAAIDAYWQRAVHEKPKMFNGPVLLQSEGDLLVRPDRRTFRARYFATDFKSFMAWRAFGVPDRRIRNGFALAALRAADGAFIAGEMGSHTASAGRVYFPGGTPDLHDVKGDRVDLAGSVMRELGEETGLFARDVDVDPDWTVLVNDRHVACLKIVRAREPAAALAERIHRMLAAEAEPELARVHILRSLADCAALPLADFMIPFLRTIF